MIAKTQKVNEMFNGVHGATVVSAHQGISIPHIIPSNLHTRWCSNNSWPKLLPTEDIPAGLKADDQVHCWVEVINHIPNDPPKAIWLSVPWHGCLAKIVLQLQAVYILTERLEKSGS